MHNTSDVTPRNIQELVSQRMARTARSRRGHDLITKEIASTIPALYSQEHVADPIVRVKFFHPLSTFTAYITEGDLNPESEDYGRLFGYTIIHEGELGYSSLQEIEGVLVGGLPVERDLYFAPKPLSEALKADGHPER